MATLVEHDSDDSRAEETAPAVTNSTSANGSDAEGAAGIDTVGAAGTDTVATAGTEAADAAGTEAAATAGTEAAATAETEAADAAGTEAAANSGTNATATTSFNEKATDDRDEAASARDGATTATADDATTTAGDGVATRRGIDTGLMSGNVFAGLSNQMHPPCEVMTVLQNGGKSDSSSPKIERIVSYNHPTAAGEWYDQDTTEFVIVLSGSATLVIEEEFFPRYLNSGDWVILPAHKKHRVEYTDDRDPTVWLAVHWR